MSPEAELVKKIYNATQPSVKKLETGASSMAANANASIKDYKQFQHKLKIAKIAALEKKFESMNNGIKGVTKTLISTNINYVRNEWKNLKNIKDKEALYDWKSAFIASAETAKSKMIEVRDLEEKMQLISLEIANVAESAIRALKQAKKDAKKNSEESVDIKLAGEKHKVEIGYIDGEIAMLSKFAAQLDARSAKYMQNRKNEKIIAAELDALIRKIKSVSVE